MVDLAKFAGIKIKSLRASFNYTQEELAQKLGIGKSAVSNYEAGYRMPKQDLLFNLAQIFHVEVNEFFPKINESQLNDISETISNITTQLEPKRQRRVLEFASNELDDQNKVVNLAEHTRSYVAGRSTAAGAPIDGDTQDSNATVVRSTEVPSGADELVTIAGDSMEPLLTQGSQVFIHWQPVVENGEIAIVSIEGDGVTCKKFYLEDDKIRLVSINESYEDMIFDREEVRVIGKVIF